MQIVTVREMAAMLQLTEETVCLWASRGRLPGFKLGKSWRFNMEEVRQWLGHAMRGDRTGGAAEQTEGKKER
jgi:excisionase family DNA binding protein